jgi:uncharacterized protein (TIGR02118 family)
VPKVVVVARRRNGSDSEARSALLAGPAEEEVAGLVAYTVHVALDEGPPDVVGVAVAVLTEGSDEDLTALPERLLGDLAAEAYLVDGRPQWDYERDWPDGVASPGLKRISFLRRVKALSRQQFGDHWTEAHAPLARRHHPGLWRYVQNVVERPLTPGAPDIDGIAELSFRTVEDMRDRMYDSTEGRETIAADVRRFIDLDAGWRVLTEENVLLS